MHRGLENWMSVTWAEIEGFWKFLKEDNVDMDAGEAEWRREQEKERERQEAAMKKMKNLPNDVRSKLGARFQEGQVRKSTSKSYLLELPYFSVVSFIWAGSKYKHYLSFCSLSKGFARGYGQASSCKSISRGGRGLSASLKCQKNIRCKYTAVDWTI